MNKNLEFKFEKVTSHLDTNKCSDPILLHGKPLEVGQFGYEIHPRIYPSGLVMLSPRWTHQSYNKFYKEYYDELYRLDFKADVGVRGIINNMKEIWDRLKNNLDLKNVNKILDAGSGPGYGLQFLKEKLNDVELFGIEASPSALKILKNEMNVDVIDNDLNGKWTSNYSNCFDLIIMRHVVEHILDPINTLKEISRTLNSNGYIYIAVPDMLHPRTILRDYDNWWEYWFRSVHPYYYNKYTLFKTLELAGLYPNFYGEENQEVWCIVSKNQTISHNYSYNSFDDQIKIINELLQ